MSTSSWEPNGTVWRNLRVLVTGHTGFMGGWLVVWLHQLGAEVSGLALPAPTSPSFYETVGVRGLLAREIIGDIRDAELVRRAVLDIRPQVLFHLAAQPIVHTAFLNPVDTFQTNVFGTINVLDSLRASSDVKAALVVTSDKVYENTGQNGEFSETDRLGGMEPYGGSKACAEIVVECYRRAYLSAVGIQVATIRAGNVIGGGDWAKDRLLPDIVRAFSEGRSLCLRSPDAVRPWQHVVDPLRGYLVLSESMLRESEGPGKNFDGPWNFGPSTDSHKTVAWIVDRCATLWGDTVHRTLQTENGFPEAQKLALSSRKAETRLGWRPSLELDSALKHTIAWYRSHLKGASMLLETIRQIDEISGRSTSPETQCHH